MDFNKLDKEQKETYHKLFMEYVEVLGSKNFFLKMIEEIREQKPNPLLNKTGVIHTPKAKITLSKAMYKDTFTQLFDSMRREEKVGDMLDGLEPKAYKSTMNMMKTLKSVNITIESKGENPKNFSFNILDTSEEKKTKITFVFKTLFFYNLNELKKVLNYTL